MSLRDTLRVLGLSGHSSVASGGAPPLSPVDGCRLYYEIDTDTLFVSVNAGAWAALAGAGGASGWTDGGTQVFLTTATDIVSVGGASAPLGVRVKLQVLAEQQVTGAVDFTEGIRIQMLQTADMVASEEQTMIHLLPGGRPGDAVQSAYTGIFADAPAVTGSTVKTVLFVQGNAAGPEFWDNVIIAVDNDLAIQCTRQTGGAPDDIILRSNVAATPSGEIRAEVLVGGVTTVMWSAIDTLGFEARASWGRRGVIRPTTAVSVNDFAPAGLATASWIILGQTAGANINITGLTGGREGRLITLTNASDVATNTITLTNEDAASAAANRFHNEDLASLVIPRGASVELMYDGTLARWRPLYT